MTKKEYQELTGEDPEDMFGGDAENIMEDWSDDGDGRDPEKEAMSREAAYDCARETHEMNEWRNKRYNRND